MQLRSKCLSSKPVGYFGLAMPIMVVFFVSSLFAQPIMRWDSAGVNLRQGYNILWDRAVAQDPVSGDMVMVWSDCRTGDRDIYAQKINLNDNPLWGEGGKQIVQAISHQEDPEVIYAGNGNWIIAWVDWRLTPEELAGKGWHEGDIFAQKVNSNGDPLWNPAGVAVCTADEGQNDIQLVSDGSGGVIIIWYDQRDSYTISAQHLTSTGQVAAGWAPNGLSLCGSYGGGTPTIDTDGNGGVIVAWSSYIAGYYDIYAQRVTAGGSFLWNANGQPICTYNGNQYEPQLCADGQGGAYIVWKDERFGQYGDDIYFQRVNSDGNPYYETDGRVLCDAPNRQQDCFVIAADDGGAIFSWMDFRHEGLNNYGDIYAQKVNASGEALWGANGMPLCTADECQRYPYIISDGAGGAIIGWEDDRVSGGYDFCIYAQRISSSGMSLWTTNGVVVCDGGWMHFYDLFLLKSDLEHGAYFFWGDSRTGFIGLYEQHLNSNGTPQLQPNGSLVHYGISGDAFTPKMVQTVPGQVLVVWADSRSGQGCSLFMQLLDSSGTLLLEQNGRLVSANSIDLYQGGLQLVSDFQQGGLLAWSDHSPGQYNQIRAQRIGPQGNTLWTPGGVHVCFSRASQVDPFIVGDGTGGAFVVWSEPIMFYYQRIYVQRLNASGIQAWSQPVQLSFNGGRTSDACYGVVPDGEGGIIVVRNAGEWNDSYVLAQRLDQSGNEVWQSGGIRVSNTTGHIYQPTVVADGTGGAVVVWDENRDLQNYDLYAQKIDRFGNLAWSDSGLSICNVPSDKWDAKLLLDCNGNVFVLWEDFRAGEDYDLYLQKIAPSGALLFPSAGLPVCVLEGSQYSPAMVSDTYNGVYITWEDERDSLGYRDIYCSHINGAGDLVGTEGLWQQNGNIVCDALFCQTNPAIAPDGGGGCIIVWEDARDIWFAEGDPNLFAQRMNDGTVVSGVGSSITCIPSEFRLEQNYPNPFNPATRINYSLANAGHVYLIIYDILGRKVCTLQNQFMTAGSHHIIWNGDTSSGDQVASGTYFYKLEVPGHSQVRKMVLLK